MKVVISTVVGNTFEIEIPDDGTLLQLKQQIQFAHRYPVPVQHLFKGDDELQDDQTLASLDLGEGDTLRIELSGEELSAMNIWNPQLDDGRTREMRLCQMLNLKYYSVFRTVFKENVLAAMSLVPRHLFIHAENYPEDVLQHAYNYQRPMVASQTSVSSSPEVIAAMLSLVRFEPSHKVCVFGIKGGYLQCVVSQMVNISGSVIVYSTDQASFAYVHERLKSFSPYANLQKWILGDALDDTSRIQKYAPFDVVFFCGAVPTIEESYLNLLREGGQLLAPVGVGRMQKLTILEKTSDQPVTRVVKDWNVTFGPLK